MTIWKLSLIHICLFTDDPNTNPDAKFIDVVANLDDNLLNMGKGTSGSKVGTGGMATKLTAAPVSYTHLDVYKRQLYAGAA